MDAFQQVRLADAVRADNRDHVGRNPAAHGETMGKAEGESV